MNLDHELRQALKRQDPPAGFADSILRRAAIAGQPPVTPVRSWRRRWLPLPIAASLLATAFGWNHYLQLQQQAEAEQAAYEITLALHIAGEKLADVQKKIQDKLRNQNDPQLQN